MSIAVKYMYLIFVLNLAFNLLLEEHYMTMSKIKKNALISTCLFLVQVILSL